MYELLKKGRPEKWSFDSLEVPGDSKVYEEVKTISDTQSIRRAAVRKGLKVSIERFANEKGALVTLRGYING